MFMSCRFLLQPRHVDGVLYVDFYGISTVNSVVDDILLLGMDYCALIYANLLY